VFGNHLLRIVLGLLQIHDLLLKEGELFLMKDTHLIQGLEFAVCGLRFAVCGSGMQVWG
jgi:hypothetical protein